LERELYFCGKKIHHLNYSFASSFIGVNFAAMIMFQIRAYVPSILSMDPESGAVAPGEVVQLRNLSGYTPQTWNEANSQLLGMQALIGDFLSTTH
jgi:hypothetical protein